MVPVAVTNVIFVATLTKAAAAFPVLIIALIPVQLSLMNRIWRREVLRFVDAWACKEGTPEDDEDETARTLRNDDQGVWGTRQAAWYGNGCLRARQIAARNTRRQEDGEDAQEQTP